jgi:RNA polymerase sigma-70 factor (ECF subfamily)
MSDENSRFQLLLRQLQEGSHEAARELADTYGEHVLRCVRYRLPRRFRSQFDSLDFAQLVWKSVFAAPEKLARLRDPEEFVKFLAIVARNKVVGAGRKLQRQKNDVQREVKLDDLASDVRLHPPSREPTPSATAVFRERWKEVVQEQPLREGQVVEMRYEGSTYEEIAQQLNMDESTARKIVRRLKRRTPPKPDPLGGP